MCCLARRPEPLSGDLPHHGNLDVGVPAERDVEGSPPAGPTGPAGTGGPVPVATLRTSPPTVDSGDAKPVITGPPTAHFARAENHSMESPKYILYCTICVPNR